MGSLLVLRAGLDVTGRRIILLETLALNNSAKHRAIPRPLSLIVFKRRPSTMRGELHYPIPEFRNVIYGTMGGLKSACKHKPGYRMQCINIVHLHIAQSRWGGGGGTSNNFLSRPSLHSYTEELARSAMMLIRHLLASIVFSSDYGGRGGVS
jgi:hypothetical protein